MIFESHDGRHQRTEWQRALGEMFMGYGRQSEGEADSEYFPAQSPQTLWAPGPLRGVKPVEVRQVI